MSDGFDNNTFHSAKPRFTFLGKFSWLYRDSASSDYMLIQLPRANFGEHMSLNRIEAEKVGLRVIVFEALPPNDYFL